MTFFSDAASSTQKPRASVFAQIAQYRAVARERRALRTLTPDQLVDLGIRREDAEKEANRRFWDLP